MFCSCRLQAPLKNLIELIIKVRFLYKCTNSFKFLYRYFGLHQLFDKESHNTTHYESTLRKFDKEYLRIRKENNVYVLNYKTLIQYKIKSGF